MASFCDLCGTPAQPGTRFCGSCGHALDGAAPTAPLFGQPTAPITITTDDIDNPSPPLPPPPTGPPPSLPPQGAEPAEGEPRSWGWRIGLGVGVIALLALGFTVYRAVWGNTAGAGSPEGAVEALAQAASDEDPLEAVAVLAPDEVSRLDDLVQVVAEQGEEDGALTDAGAPLAGLDIAVTDLDLEVEQLSDDVARVTVNNADLDAQFDPDGLGEGLRDLLEGDDDDALETDSASYEVTEDPEDYEGLGIYTYDDDTGEEEYIPPFVMTVRRDGRWFVSPLYTAAEYARLSFGFDEVDFDGEVSSAEGAEDPEGAVEALVDAASDIDLGDTIAQLPPDQLRVAYDYEEAIDDYLSYFDLESSLNVQVDDLELDAEVAGEDLAVVTIGGGSGNIEYYNEDEGDSTSTQFSGDDTCGQFSSSSYDGDDDYSEGEACLDTVLGSAAPDDAFVVTVRRGDRWFVSPIDTVLAYGQLLVENGIIDDILDEDFS